MSAALAISTNHCMPVSHPNAMNDNVPLEPVACPNNIIQLYPKSGPKKALPEPFLHGPSYGARCARVYDAGGALVHVDNVSAGEETDYISGPMGALARYKNTRLTYLHNDHLGSAQSGTTSTGSVRWRERYSPFGSELVGNAANEDLGGFTGHIKDSATGLNYMQARYYDPVIGRFLSIDPVTFASTGDPRFFNRYAYTFNDPINLLDPDGARPVPRPAPRGHNGGPPMRLEHLGNVSHLRSVNPKFRPSQAGFNFTSSSIANTNKAINDVTFQYNVFGTGNLDGSNVSRPADTGGIVGANIRGVLSGATLDSSNPNLKGNGFQFNASGGTSAAGDAFRQITGQDSIGDGNSSFSLGASDVNVNLGQSKSTGDTSLRVTISTARTGSRIKTKTTVKIRFREENK